MQEVVVADLPESTTSRTLDHLNGEQTVCVCVFKYSCSNLPATLVEEGAKQLTLSSSFEISLRAEPAQHKQSPRMPTLNFTHPNIEHHAKTAKTEPGTPFRNRNSGSAATRKVELSH